MSQHDSKILWLKDLLEHISDGRNQLQWTENPETIRVLTENMLRDLETCRRLCEDLNRRAYRRQAG